MRVTVVIRDPMCQGVNGILKIAGVTLHSTILTKLPQNFADTFKSDSNLLILGWGEHHDLQRAAVRPRGEGHCVEAAQVGQPAEHRPAQAHVCRYV